MGNRYLRSVPEDEYSNVDAMVVTEANPESIPFKPGEEKKVVYMRRLNTS